MKDARSIFREYFEALLIAAIFLGFSNNFVVKTFFIPSGSMEDTLLIGDHLFVNRHVFAPGSDLERRLTPERDVRRGDIVIFRSTGADPAPDPIVYLHGGPAGGIVENVNYFYEDIVAPFLATRDVVLFDQRGSGLALPDLNCDPALGGEHAA